MSSRLIRWIVRLLQRMTGGKLLKYGCCCIYGRNDFIDHCKQAIALLEEEDALLSQTLASSKWIFVESYQHGHLYTNTRVYGISERWSSWGKYGIAVGMVHACMIQRLDLKYPPENDKLSAQRSTAEWLRQHDFPPPLVACLETVKN